MMLLPEAWLAKARQGWASQGQARRGTAWHGEVRG